MISSKDGIIGFAIGDAMGVPVEFTNREKLMRNPITSMEGFMSHNVPKGDLVRHEWEQLQKTL